MLVTSALPLRVYLFDGGVVPFGAAPGSASPANPDPGGPAKPDPGGAQPAANAGADLIVNLWRLDRSQARKPAQRVRAQVLGSHSCSCPDGDFQQGLNGLQEAADKEFLAALLLASGCRHCSSPAGVPCLIQS